MEFTAGRLSQAQPISYDQGLDNRIIEPGDDVGQIQATIQRRQRFGDMLQYYYREAA